MRGWLQRNRQLLVRALGTLLTLGLLVFLLYEQGWQEISAALAQVEPWRFAAAVGLFLLSRLSTVGRWYVLLRSAGVDMPPARTCSLTFTGLFASNFLPTTIGGDVVRLGGAMKMGYDRAVCLASIAADRLIGMAGMAMVLPFGLAPLLDLNPGGGPALSGVAPAALWARAVGFVRRMLQSLTLWMHKPGALALALAFTWIHMLCTFLSVEVILTGLGQPVSFWLIAGLWSLAYFVTLVPVSINGYGVQELSLTWLFTRLAGVSMASALVLAVVMRLATMAASLPGALTLPGTLGDLAGGRMEGG